MVLLTNDGNVWIVPEMYGIYRYNKYSNRLTHYLEFENDPELRGWDYINNIHIDKNNILWLEPYAVWSDSIQNRRK